MTEWLEIGIGDGNNLLYLLAELGHDRKINVTAIDPSPLAARRLGSKHKIDVLPVPVEAFVPSKDYDCINVRQSAYYFKDPMGSLAAIAGWLSPDGVLAITIWSDECILYWLNRKIAQRICSDDVELRAEDLLGALSAAGFVVERQRVYCGTLDFARLGDDDASFEALCALAARKMNIDRLTKTDMAELRADLQLRKRAEAERSNELIFVRRKISPPTSKPSR